MNGAIGKVKGFSGDRVAVAFPPPLGDKALKPENLKDAPTTKFEVHPDAREPPSFTFRAELAREAGEDLGLGLLPVGPTGTKPGEEPILTVTGVMPDGFIKKYNEGVKDPGLRVCENDMIMGVVDCSIPDSERRPVGGNAKLILEVIKAGRTPLVLLMRRVLGPPLRFSVVQRVMVNFGEKGWLEGQVLTVWKAAPNGTKVPYVIRMKEGGHIVTASQDIDQCVKKAEPRWRKGDAVMCRRQGSYQKAIITEVKDLKAHTSYLATLEADKQAIEVPEEINQFVRPLARFTEGMEVEVKMQHGFVPGKIEAVYHPNWVYAVRQENGEMAFVPQDDDAFCKKR